MDYVAFKSNGVWQYFLRVKGEQSAQSRQCHNIIKTVGGTTTDLHVHLKTKHSVELYKATDSGLANKCNRRM